MNFLKSILGFGENGIFTKMAQKMKENSAYKEYKRKETSYYNSVAVKATPEKVKFIVDKGAKMHASRRVAPPSYEEYIQYPHRSTTNIHNTRIGDVCFSIPPEFIAVQDKTPSQSVASLRQRGAINIARGYSRKDISMTIYCNGLDQVNGYKVDAPGGHYYVDGLRPLLAEFLLTPYVPIVNDLLNDQYGIYNVVLNNIMVSTVDGYPNTFEVTLTMSEVTLAPYIETADVLYHDMIDWDLFRFNYQRLLTDTYTVKTRLPKITGTDGGNFAFMQIKTDAISGDNINDNDIFHVGNFDTIISSSEDDINIENISFSYQNMAPLIQMSGHNVPTSQYVGGSGGSFSITLSTTSEETIGKIASMNSYTQYLSKQYKELGTFGFIRVQNELINMTGTEFIIIDQISTTSVPGIPGLYQVSIICSEFDHRQKERESLVGITPFPDNVKGTKGDAISQDAVGLYNKILQDNIVEGKMSRMEMYPDLFLPLIGEIDGYIGNIIAFRDKHGLENIKYETYPRSFSLTPGDGPFGTYELYADPDFYVFYPIEYSKLDDSVFNTFISPKKMEPVTTTGRSVGFGEEAEAPDGFRYDENGKLQEIKSGGNGDSNSGSGSDSGVSVPAGNTGNPLADLMLSRQGCGYVWGAQGEMYNESVRRTLESRFPRDIGEYVGTEKWYGKQSFDCSGIICWALRELGAAPAGYRKNNDGVFADYATPISRSELQPGDLVQQPGVHIGVYIGNEKTIEAMNKEQGVKIGNLRSSYTRFGRLKANFTKSPNSRTGEPPQARTPSGGGTVTEEHLNRFLKNGLANTGKYYIASASKYGLNPCFTVALSCQETGWGKAPAISSHNNPGGIMDWDNNWKTLRRFNSLADGIDFVHKNLKNLYLDKGLTTIDAIGAKYAPIGAANDPNHHNKHWVPNITSIYKDITGESTVRVTGDGAINPETPDGYEEQEYKDYVQKKGENHGVVFGSTVVDLSYQNFGAPFYRPSPVMHLFKEDNIAGKVTEGLLNTIHSGIEVPIVGGVLGLVKSEKECVRTPLGDVEFKIQVPFTDGSLTGFITNNAAHLITDFWVVETVMDWSGDLAGWLGGVFTTNPFNNYGNGVEAFLIKEEAAMNSMYTDMMFFNQRGRLNRAFPGYLFMIADDGGDWLDGRKLWSNFYMYKSVLDISIHQERSQPVHTAQVSITNIHHNLNSKPKASDIKAKIEEDPEYNGLVRWLYKKTGSLMGTPKLTNMMVDVKNQLYDAINIKPGLNIHIRIGYGSNPLMYPIVFNGVVTDMSVGDTVDMVAQSYGIELINNVISTKPQEVNKMFNGGSESSDVISSILTERDGWIRNTLSKKWGEASKYGIEHFGLPRGHEQIAQEKEYDILKNIYYGKYKPKLLCGGSGFANADGEKNSNFYLFNKTPWDAFQSMAQTLPEFVCQPMYHQFECRQFFGLPFWLAKYRYDYVNNGVCETAKTFAQFHYIDTMSDIIDNQIKTVGDDIDTNCVAMYTLGSDVKSTPTVYSDRSILCSSQKTKVIDSTLEQDYLGPDWLYEKTIAPVAKSAAIRMAVSNLIDSWNKSYDGEVIIIGDSCIKPCDYVMINDLYANINGLCGVREVVHSISPTGGFTTSITPDMIAMNTMKEAGSGNVYKSLISFGMSYGAVKGTRFSMINMASMYSQSVSMGRSLLASKYENPAFWTAMTAIPNVYIGRYVMASMGTGKMVTNFTSFASSLGSTMSKIDTTVAKNSVKALLSAKKIKTIASGVKGAKAILTVVGTAVFPGAGTVAAWIIGTVVFDMILGAIVDEFQYNNSVKVFPLVHKDGAFITGCKGQTKLITGIAENSDVQMSDDQTDKDNENNSNAR